MSILSVIGRYLTRRCHTSILVWMSKGAQLDFLVDTLLRIKNEQEMVDFLLGLFTPKELKEVPKRLQIVKKLKQGIPQHQIAKELGIGVATVTRGSKELHKGRFKTI